MHFFKTLLLRWLLLTLVILLTLNKSKKISSHFPDFEHVNIFSNFTDFEHVENLIAIL